MKLQPFHLPELLYYNVRLCVFFCTYLLMVNHSIEATLIDRPSGDVLSLWA